MTDIIDEISYDFSQIKILKFLTKYSLHITIFFMILFSSISAIIWYNNSLNNKYEYYGEQYYNIFKNSLENDDKSFSNLIDIIDSKNGYNKIANFEKANLLLQKKKINEAVDTYDKIASNLSTDIAMQYLAKLIAVNILIESSNDKDNIETRIEELDTSNNPFYISSLFTKLNWLCINKNYKLAQKLAEDILENQNISHNAKKRANLYLNIFKIYQ